MVTRKKKRKILQDLAHLTAIESDYIRDPDSTIAAKLLAEIAYELDKKHGCDDLIDMALQYSKARHENAENSTPIVGGKEHEEKTV